MALSFFSQERDYLIGANKRIVECFPDLEEAIEHHIDVFYGGSGETSDDRNASTAPQNTKNEDDDENGGGGGGGGGGLKIHQEVCALSRRIRQRAPSVYKLFWRLFEKAYRKHSSAIDTSLEYCRDQLDAVSANSSAAASASSSSATALALLEGVGASVDSEAAYAKFEAVLEEFVTSLLFPTSKDPEKQIRYRRQIMALVCMIGQSPLFGDSLEIGQHLMCDECPDETRRVVMRTLLTVFVACDIVELIDVGLFAEYERLSSAALVFIKNNNLDFIVDKFLDQRNRTHEIAEDVQTSLADTLADVMQECEARNLDVAALTTLAMRFAFENGLMTPLSYLQDTIMPLYNNSKTRVYKHPLYSIIANDHEHLQRLYSMYSGVFLGVGGRLTAANSFATDTIMSMFTAAPGNNNNNNMLQSIMGAFF